MHLFPVFLEGKGVNHLTLCVEKYAMESRKPTNARGISEISVIASAESGHIYVSETKSQ